jgi:starch synthase
MRILTVTHFYEAHGGGIERVAGHLCRWFTRLGATPIWAASDEDAMPVGVEPVGLACFNGIERLTGLPLPIPRRSAVQALRRVVATTDAIVIHDALYITSILALLFGRRAKIPVLLVQHVGDIPFSNPALRFVVRMANRLITHPMLRAADQVVFISATTRETFADVRTRRPPLLLFNGVDGTVFNPGMVGEDISLRRQLGVPADKKMVLFVGRFVEKKGLSIIAALARARPDLQFVLAGQGPIDPKRWNLANVTIVEGLSGPRLATTYRAADVLVLPSVGEGFPLVIQEAMACGLPVVCGEASARADPEATRWLTGVSIDLARQQETAERLSQAIDSLSMDATARAAMAHYAQITYDWERMAHHIVAELSGLGQGSS